MTEFIDVFLIRRSNRLRHLTFPPPKTKTKKSVSTIRNSDQEPELLATERIKNFQQHFAYLIRTQVSIRSGNGEENPRNEIKICIRYRILLLLSSLWLSLSLSLFASYDGDTF